MKMLIAVIALAASLSAVAADQKHMVSVGTDNQTLGSLAWTSSKTRGSDSTETKNYNLSVNYAYAIADHFQLGTKLNYLNEKARSSNEQYALQVGGIWNMNTDFRKSLYASLYVGWDWGHQTRTANGNEMTENFNTTVAVGHRYPLSFLNLENVTFSPEIAYVTKNPTKSSSTEWTQGLEFRLLQFAVFF